MSDHRMNHTESVKEQYTDSKNLNTRISIHDKYSTNKQGFGNWIYEQYHFFDGCRVLELGCGTGSMWEGRFSDPGAEFSLILSDFSQGMVQLVEDKFSRVPRVSFEQINIEEIPYGDETFDIVIANMMLYHVPDLNRGLREVSRVLKKGGRFYCATFGEHGIQEYLTTTLAQYGVTIDISGAFTLQNGEEILKMHFPEVRRADYIDSLEVTEIDDLLDYISSMESIGRISSLDREEWYHCFETKKNERGGLTIPKEYGMFLCGK